MNSLHESDPKPGPEKQPGNRFKRTKVFLVVILAIAVALGFSWEGASSPTKTLLLAMLDYLLHGKDENYQVVGDVGGAPFSIPRTVAKWVEYDDEVEYKQRRKGLPDEKARTVKDKLASFGFTTHFPDMALWTPDVIKRERERGKESMFTTTWIDVGVTSHSHYFGGALGLERLVKAIPEMMDYRGPGFAYQRQFAPVHGLIAYRPMQKFVSAQGEVTWKPVEDHSFYYHLDENGKVDAYIRCYFVKHEASPCEHSFLMLPTMTAWVNIHYRNGLLPHWQEIQNSVRQIILGFVVAPSNPAVTQ